MRLRANVGDSPTRGLLEVRGHDKRCKAKYIRRDELEAGAISVEALKVRRDRLAAEQRAVRGRIEEIAAQDQDRSRLNQLADDLTAFAATLREGLDNLDFAGRQRLVRLLIERVVVTGDHVAIEHAIPLSGRLSALRSQDQCPRVPNLQGGMKLVATRPADCSYG
jgi:hypothetical protein